MSASSAFTKNWKMTLISPLHVGDGNKLFMNLDFRVRPTGIEVIDFNALSEQLADIPGAIHDLSKDVRLERIIQDYKLSFQPMYTLKYTGAMNPKEIRSFLKNAHGEVYIAGSTLKGAIHTALWTGLDMSGIPSPRVGNKDTYKTRFRKKVEQLGGGDPYHMFIRPLQVSDSTSLIPQGNLSCEEIKFFNLQFKNQPGWKDFSSKTTVADFRKASGMHVEALRQGVSLVAQVHIDPLLAEETIRHAAGIKRSEHVSSFDRMIARIREHSKQIAERERAFFQQYGRETQGVVDFYDRLIRRMDDVADTSDSFILRMAWGSGWRGMTGDWISDEDMTFIRENEFEKLGKPRVRIFPKTRRLAVDPNTETPSLPLGWVLVEPVETEAFRRVFLSAATQDRPTESTGSRAVSSSPAQPVSLAPANDPQTLRAEKLNNFQQRLNAVKTLQAEVEQWIQTVRRETDTDTKRQMASMLLQKAEALPKKAYANALKEKKLWATRLKELVDETR
ncbi:MAG: RAMP superfamily CRISPR-associated protein [Thermodesulfobacteriota bacterium]